MTAGDAGDSGRQRPAATSIAALQKRIMEQLAASEKVAEVLRGQLTACHRRNDELVRERNDLLKTLARMDPTLGQAAEPRPLPPAGSAAAELEELRRECAEQQQRCAALEQALAEQRRARSLAQEEIACLEEQVTQLQSTVDLLCEHLDLEAPDQDPDDDGWGEGQDPL